MKDKIKIPDNILATLEDLTNGALNYYKAPKTIELKYKLILDYITNLQEEVKSANESITWWQNRFNALQEENERLKDSLETMTFTAKVKQEAVDSLISRIDKAIEMFDDEILNEYYYGMSYEFEINDFKEDMLNILKGE